MPRAKIAYRKAKEGNSCFSVPDDFDRNINVSNLTVPSIADEGEKAVFLNVLKRPPTATDLDKLREAVNNMSTALLDRIDTIETILLREYTVHECADFPDQELLGQSDSRVTMRKIPDGEYVPNVPTPVTRRGIEVLVLDHPNELRELLKAARAQENNISGNSIYSTLTDYFSGSDRNFSFAQFYTMDLRGVNFSKANLEDTSFENSVLTDTNFTMVNASRAHFTRAYLQRVNFSKANLEDTSFVNSVLTGTNFTNVNASRSDFTRADIDKDTTFTGAVLNGARFDGVDSHNGGVNFSNAELVQTRFVNSQLSGSNFNGVKASMATFEVANLEKASFAQADLSSAHFQFVNMKGADFTLAKIDGTDFSNGTDLAGAKFIGVQAINAHFEHATFDSTTSFERANLRGANFKGCDLRGVDFTGANLEGANFEGAILEGAIFNNCIAHNTNFSGAIVNDKTSFANSDLIGAHITPESLHQTNYPKATLPNNEDYNVFLDQDVLARTKVAMKALRDYGKTLYDEADKSDDKLTSDKASAVAILYQELKTKYKKMEECVNRKDMNGANQARNEFMDTLLKKETTDVFAKSRDVSWKRIVGTIALCLTGVGMVVAGVDIGYRFATGKHLLFGQTKTTEHANKIQQAMQGKDETSGYRPGGSGGSR